MFDSVHCVVQAGDVLYLSQYTAGTAGGGINLGFTDGSSTLVGLADQNGQPNLCDATKNQWHRRVFSLNAFAGKTLADTYLANGGSCAPSGQFDIYFNDIAISGNGTTSTIYSPHLGQVFSPIGSYGTNLRAVAESNTASPDSAVHYYAADTLGSTQAELSNSGWPTWQGDFTPFGQEIVMGTGQLLLPGSSDATTMRFKFTGKERDAETGNDYFGARYYGSSMGRFMSPDPLNLTEERLVNPSNTLNKYSYAANNPLKYVDPDGEDVTYFYDQGGIAGHAVLFAYNQATGDSAIESFGPIVHSPLAAGESMFEMGTFHSADDLRANFASLTIQTSPELAQQVIAYIRANPDPANWFALGPNCSTQCIKILQKFKLANQKDSGRRPKLLWNTLTQQYNPSAPANPKNGTDYGKPRTDMFNAMWLSLPQAPKNNPEGTPKRNVAPPCLKDRNTGNCQ